MSWSQTRSPIELSGTAKNINISYELVSKHIYVYFANCTRLMHLLSFTSLFPQLQRIRRHFDFRESQTLNIGLYTKYASVSYTEILYQIQFEPTKDRHLCETRLELFVRVSGSDIQSRRIFHDKKLG